MMFKEGVSQATSVLRYVLGLAIDTDFGRFSAIQMPSSDDDRSIGPQETCALR